MSKITKSAAENIALLAVDHGLSKAQEDIRARGDALAVRLLAGVWAEFPSVTEDQKAEKGLFAHRSEFHVRTSMGRVSVSSRVALPVPYKLAHWGDDLTPEKELGDEIAQLAVDKDKLRGDRVKMRAQTIAAVLSFGTWQKLEAGWPEIWPIAKGYRPVSVDTRALVSVSALNSALGLPPEDEVIAAADGAQND
jgi:hypothetical protein